MKTHVSISGLVGPEEGERKGGKERRREGKRKRKKKNKYSLKLKS